jgi:putative transposase
MPGIWTNTGGHLLFGALAVLAEQMATAKTGRMPRRLRLEFSGACYHVTNRGNYRQPIFATDGAAHSFQACLDEVGTSHGWRVHAYSIMSNHFHLVLETPEPNLSDGMQWLQSTWARRFNNYRGVTGRPFQGRFHTKSIEPGYVVAQVAHYVHLNPVEAGLVPVERVGEYLWSSLRQFPRRDRPKWLEATTVLTESGGLADSTAGWQAYGEYLGVLWEKEPMMREKKFAKLAREWALGSTAFRAELRERLDRVEDRRERFSLLGAERPAVLAARAELWEEQLRALARAFKVQLGRLPKKHSADEKLLLAFAMKRTTSASARWLAQRLQMGSPSSLGSLLHRFRSSGALEEPAIKATLSKFLA